MKFFVPASVLGLALAATSCDRPPVVRQCNYDAAVPCPNLDNPYARIEGTVIYQGPEPPLDDAGLPTGRIVLLLFLADNPPPPQGTATTAISVQTISASELFRNATRLPNNDLRAAIAYSFPNIAAAGEYQIRAFYSRNTSLTGTVSGQEITSRAGFDPIFGVRQLPVRGDVGGGAIVDPNAATPHFVRIQIGDRTVDDTGAAHFQIPMQGYVAQNVTIFIGQQFALDRPVFHALLGTEVTDPNALSRMTARVAPPPPGVPMDGPYEVPPPSEFLVQHARDTGLLPAGSPMLDMPRNVLVTDADTGSDIPAFSLRFSLPNTPGMLDECEIATLAGVPCPARDAIQQGFIELALDRDENGSIDLTRSSLWADAHPTLITTNPLGAATNGRLPWIYPLVILSKLHEPTDEEAEVLRRGIGGTITREIYERIRTSLNTPEGIDPAHNRYPVLVFGSVLPGRMATNFVLRPWTSGFRQFEDVVRIAVIPIAVEIHGPNQATDWWGILPPGSSAIAGAAGNFAPSTFRCDVPRPDVPLDEDTIQPAGVPAGRYAINLLGPGGQAWTTPNELAGYVRLNPAHVPGETPARRAVVDANIAATTAACTMVTGPGTARVPYCRAPSQGLVVRFRGLDNVTGYCPSATGPVPGQSTCRAGAGMAGSWCDDPMHTGWPRRDPSAAPPAMP